MGSLADVRLPEIKNIQSKTYLGLNLLSWHCHYAQPALHTLSRSERSDHPNRKSATQIPLFIQVRYTRNLYKAHVFHSLTTRNPEKIIFPKFEGSKPNNFGTPMKLVRPTWLLFLSCVRDAKFMMLHYRLHMDEYFRDF